MTTARVDPPAADAIFGAPVAVTTDRFSFDKVLDAAGLCDLDGAAVPEQVESALVRLRERLPADLDSLSRETLKLDIRQRLKAQHVTVTAGQIDAALAPAPVAADVEDKPRASQATRIVDLVLGSGAELWHTPAGDAHVSVPVGDHVEHHRLHSRAAKDWAARAYYQTTKTAAGSQSIADALAVLAGTAVYDGPEHDTAVRVAGSVDDTVYLDLGDATWRAVAITSAGWQVVDRPPVRFLRGRGVGPLPVPRAGGHVDDLRDVLNVADEDAFRLLIAMLVGALRPAGPYPVLSLVGEQGSGKSCAARVVKRLIDPHDAELRAEPRSIDDLMIAANRSHMPAFDNLSHIAPWLSDGLCRVSTGGALSKRELFTDGDEVIIEAIKPVVITSIRDVITRGDLLDRAIVVTVPVLATRRSEADLWRQFDGMAPGVLGALLDGVVSALRRERATRLTRMPRLGDWATWAQAAEAGLGWPDGLLVDAYFAMRDGVADALLDGDPLAVAVRALTLPWTGTATELLSRLTPAGRAPRGWPESPRGLSAALRALAPNLRRAGIEITADREGNTGRRLIRIDTCEHGRISSSPSSLPSLRPDSLAKSGDANSDASSDARRGTIVTRSSPDLLARDDGDGSDAPVAHQSRIAEVPADGAY